MKNVHPDTIALRVAETSQLHHRYHVNQALTIHTMVPGMNLTVFCALQEWHVQCTHKSLITCLVIKATTAPMELFNQTSTPVHLELTPFCTTSQNLRSVQHVPPAVLAAGRQDLISVNLSFALKAIFALEGHHHRLAFHALQEHILTVLI